MNANLDSTHWEIQRDGGPVIATAIHNGHEMRRELAQLSALDPTARLREEDPYTGRVAARFGTHVVIHTSRFEVDLNRPRNSAVYRIPEDAWGLELWAKPLDDNEAAASLAMYDRFYAEIRSLIEEAIDDHGFFVLYDIHSYNHRRNGPDADPEPRIENPEINLGTGTLPDKWRPVADAFTSKLAETGLDVRENIKFRGGHLSTWTHETYGDSGCALAIELKKTFMDEWSGEVDGAALEMLARAIHGTQEPILAAARTV